MTELERTLDVEDVARLLKISVYTVKNRLRSGELQGYKQGARWRIKRECFLDYERRLSEGGIAHAN